MIINYGKSDTATAIVVLSDVQEHKLNKIIKKTIKRYFILFNSQNRWPSSINSRTI